MMTIEKSAIHIKAANQAGTFLRIAMILNRKQFEIKAYKSLESTHEGFSELLFSLTGPKENLCQLKKELTRLIDVVEAKEITPITEHQSKRSFNTQLNSNLRTPSHELR